jgi:hypothetical protein
MPLKPRLKVAICGSFKRSTDELADAFLELETTGCRVLSPLSLNFSNNGSEFLTLPSETTLSVAEIEKFHLRAIAESDFIWLHAPEGYLGVSGAFELGYAYALGKPVFAYNLPSDLTLREFVQAVTSVYKALQLL